MSNYSELLKNGFEYCPADYEIGADEHKKLDKKYKEVQQLQAKLQKAVLDVADYRENLLKEKYEPSPIKKAVYYRRNGRFYDWNTGAMVDDAKEYDLVIETDIQSFPARVFLGWDISKGVVVVGNYNINIKAAQEKMTRKFVNQKVYGMKDEIERWGRDIYTCTEETQAFVKRMFDIDFEGESNILDLFHLHSINVNFEMILREYPKELQDTLMHEPCEVVMSPWQYLQISKSTYREAKEKGFLTEVYTIRRNFPEFPETEIIPFLEATKRAEEQFDFYGIDAYGYRRVRLTLKGNKVASALLNAWKESLEQDSDYSFNRHYSWKHFYEYVIEGTINQGFTQMYRFIDTLRDYLRMCVESGSKPVLYSSYLTQTHDITARNYSLVLNEIQEANFKKQYEGYTDEKVGRYTVIFPRSSNDLKEEGNRLGHCVGSYIKDVADGRCKIFFLRINPEESLITFEVSDNRVVQIRGARNRAASSAERQAIYKWADAHDVQY